jgi:hypothetical protein
MLSGLLPVNTKAVEAFWQLFVVNPAAFTIQSDRPHPESGRHYYFQVKADNKPAPHWNAAGAAATYGCFSRNQPQREIVARACNSLRNHSKCLSEADERRASRSSQSTTAYRKVSLAMRSEVLWESIA